jgi:preprotein translocase subunit YajC
VPDLIFAVISVSLLIVFAAVLALFIFTMLDRDRRRNEAAANVDDFTNGKIEVFAHVQNNGDE